MDYQISRSAGVLCYIAEYNRIFSSLCVQGTPGAPGSPGNTGPQGKQGELGPPVSQEIMQQSCLFSFAPLWM